MKKLLAALALIHCAFAVFLAAREQPAYHQDTRKAAMPLPFTKYADMHSGYRDPDGTRMEAFLRCWKEQTLQWAEKNGKQKEAAALSGRYQTQDALDALPPSAQNFWRAAGKVGWLPLYELKEEGEIRFWAPSKIQPLKSAMPMDYDILKETRSVATPDRYYLYNSSQWSVSASDVDDYIVYGDEGEGIFYGEIHNEQSQDGEYQFIFCAPHGPNFRVKSFAHLLIHFYLEEYQLAHERDTSLGHIYYFDGDWNKTCVPLLFDADEIASWRG